MRGCVHRTLTATLLAPCVTQDRVAAVSFVVMCQSFLAIDLIVLFPIERAVYLRDQVRRAAFVLVRAAGCRSQASTCGQRVVHLACQQASGLYRTSSFYFGRSLAETPFHLLFGFLVGVITYVHRALLSLLLACAFLQLGILTLAACASGM